MLWDKTADQDIKDWYRNLIQMRKQYPALRKGAYFTVFSDSADNILEFTRELENERIYIIIHKGNNSIDTTCLVSESEVTFTEILDRDLIVHQYLDFCSVQSRLQRTLCLDHRKRAGFPSRIDLFHHNHILLSLPITDAPVFPEYLLLQSLRQPHIPFLPPSFFPPLSPHPLPGG